MFHNYKFKNLDIKLIISVIALTIIGIFVIGSANEANQQKQILGMILGILVMTGMALLDYGFGGWGSALSGGYSLMSYETDVENYSRYQ